MKKKIRFDVPATFNFSCPQPVSHFESLSTARNPGEGMSDFPLPNVEFSFGPPQPLPSQGSEELDIEPEDRSGQGEGWVWRRHKTTFVQLAQQPDKPFGAVATPSSHAVGIFGQPGAEFGAISTTSTGFGAMPASLHFGGFTVVTTQSATSTALSGDQPTRPIMEENESSEKISHMKDELEKAEQRKPRLMEAFKRTFADFREVVYQLTGYRIDLLADQKYRLTPLYAESSADHLLFQKAKSGEIEMLESEFSRELGELMELHLEKQNSIPMFLAGLIRHLWRRQSGEDEDENDDEDEEEDEDENDDADEEEDEDNNDNVDEEEEEDEDDNDDVDEEEDCEMERREEQSKTREEKEDTSAPVSRLYGLFGGVKLLFNKTVIFLRRRRCAERAGKTTARFQNAQIC